MDAVAEVTNPVLELWRVVLGHDGAVGDDGGVAGDGGPFAGVVAEGHIAVGVGVDVVCLSRLGVGVEDQINAAVLLMTVLVVTGMEELFEGETYRTCYGHAA